MYIFEDRCVWILDTKAIQVTVKGAENAADNVCGHHRNSEFRCTSVKENEG